MVGFWARLGSLGGTGAVLLAMILVLSLGEGGARFLSPIYLSDQGTSLGAIGLSMSVFGAAAMAARFFVAATFRVSAVRALIATSALASAVALFLITTTSSIALFTLLMAIHGLGWGTLSTVLLTLVLKRKGQRSAAVVIGWYVGLEGIGRAGAPVVAGFVGATFGASTGIRINTGILAVTALVGIAVFRSATTVDSEGKRSRRRVDLGRFRHAPLAVWVACLTGFYLNTTNAVLNTFFPLLGLTIGLSLDQIGALAGSRSAVSAAIRFFAAGVFKRYSFTTLFVPLYAVNALTTALVGTVVYYPAQFALWLPNGASRGLLRVGTMAQAMDESEDDEASVTAALIGAGYDAGRIAGPAAGGLIAGAFGLSTMFVVMPIAFLALLLPLALRARLRSAENAKTL